MEQIFNKLVRDNIPDIIKNNGDEAVTRTLEREEYRTELNKKLLEEVNEVLDAGNNEETLEELADVLEIIKSIAELNNNKLDDVINAAEQKRIKRGGFEKRIFLEKTYSKNNN